MDVIGIEDLAGLMLEPNLGDSIDSPYLVVDLTGGEALHADLLDRFVGWAGHQALVLIGLSGLSGGEGGPLASGFDVLVDGRTELADVLAGVQANPRASLVLVQVLRAGAVLPIPQALHVESLGYGTLLGGLEFDQWLKARDPRFAVGKFPVEAPVKLHRSADALRLTLNHPENRNALSASMRDALSDALRLIVVDEEIKEVQIDANGPCFSAGGDLSEFGSQRDLASGHQTRSLRMPAQYLAACSERVSVHVHGACIGAGIELSAFARRVTATSDAFFRLPEVAMGLIPGAGGCVSIPRRIGRQRTAFMALSGKDIDATTALRFGLIDAIAD